MKLAFCVACGLDAPAHLEQHHLVPRSEGGPDDKFNTITLCHVCHGRLHGARRAHISRLTKEGLERARKNGRIGGNPRLKARDPDAIRNVQDVCRVRAHRTGGVRATKE